METKDYALVTVIVVSCVVAGIFYSWAFFLMAGVWIGLGTHAHVLHRRRIKRC